MPNNNDKQNNIRYHSRPDVSPVFSISPAALGLFGTKSLAAKPHPFSGCGSSLTANLSPYMISMADIKLFLSVCL